MQNKNYDQLTPWKRIFTENRGVSQLPEKNHRFFFLIPVCLLLHSPPHSIMSQMNPFNALSCHFILILHSHITYVFQVVFFLQAVTSTMYPLLFPFHTCQMPRPSQLPFVITLNTIRRGIKIKKLLITQFSPAFCHFLLFQNNFFDTLFSITPLIFLL